MTSLQLHLRARSPMDVPWDRARESRVLVGALRARRRRAFQRLALELVAAMVVTFVAGRVLQRAAVESGSAAEQRKGLPVGGFAGTGGHGGAGSTGHGGSAGTG